MEILAYADDLAIICRDEKELLKVMSILDEWTMENKILVNKKKSGVLIVDCNKRERKEINGYHAKTNYRYLGMVLYRAIDPRGSVIFVNNKLQDYLTRNNRIIKKYFTPRSLIILGRYYQESKIIYGLNGFLDMSHAIDVAQRASLKYL